MWKLMTAITLVAAPSFSLAAENLPACNEPLYCAQNSDDTAGCIAINTQTQLSFTEPARPFDNACAIKLRLRDTICRKGLDSSEFTGLCWPKVD